MAKKVMNPEDRELRNIALALGAGLLGFPVLTLVSKLFAFVQFIAFGYVS